MSRGLSSEELKDPFSRAMKRFVEPEDAWTPRQLWAIRILGYAGAIYAVVSFGGLRQPAGIALCVGSFVVLGLCEQLRKLRDRVERLESDVMLRDLRTQRPIPTADPS
jgi:hypothetical protein